MYEYVSSPTLYLFTAQTLKAELIPYMIFLVMAVDGGDWRLCSGCSRQPGLPVPNSSVLSPR